MNKTINLQHKKCEDDDYFLFSSSSPIHFHSKSKRVEECKEINDSLGNISDDWEPNFHIKTKSNLEQISKPSISFKHINKNIPKSEKKKQFEILSITGKMFINS